MTCITNDLDDRLTRQVDLACLMPIPAKTRADIVLSLFLLVQQPREACWHIHAVMQSDSCSCVSSYVPFRPSCAPPLPAALPGCAPSPCEPAPLWRCAPVAKHNTRSAGGCMRLLLLHLQAHVHVQGGNRAACSCWWLHTSLTLQATHIASGWCWCSHAVEDDQSFSHNR